MMNEVTSIVNVKNNRPDVMIDRTTKWGNPYHIGTHGTREEVIARYYLYLLRTPELYNSVHELEGLTLGCHCDPLPCHGDILICIIYDMEDQLEDYKKIIEAHPEW